MEPNFSPARNETPPMARGGWLRSRIGLWFGSVVAVLAITAFIASFFLGDMLRPRIESSMNGRLKDYHVTLGHAHLQLTTFYVDTITPDYCVAGSSCVADS
jgi:hypothetical protein